MATGWSATGLYAGLISNFGTTYRRYRRLRAAAARAALLGWREALDPHLLAHRLRARRELARVDELDRPARARVAAGACRPDAGAGAAPGRSTSRSRACRRRSAAGTRRPPRGEANRTPGRLVAPSETAAPRMGPLTHRKSNRIGGTENERKQHRPDRHRLHSPAWLQPAFWPSAGSLYRATSQKDSDGYLSTDTHRFEAGTRALATENLDVDLGDADWVARRMTSARPEYRSSRATTSRCSWASLARPTSRTTCRAFRTRRSRTSTPSPFDADYEDHAGDRRPVAPADSHIWAASEHGSGKQTLNWDIEDGDYSVVVMNADGSPESTPTSAPARTSRSSTKSDGPRSEAADSSW